MTIAQLIANAREDLKIDPGKNIWTDAQLTRWANEGINILRTQSDLKVSFEEADITLVDGTASYAKETDYRKMLYAKTIDTTAASTDADEGSMEIMTDNLVEFRANHDMQVTNDVPTTVWEEDDKIYVYPIPTAACAAKYKVRIGYSDYIADLTSSESPDFQSKWHNIIEYYIRYKALRAIPGKEEMSQLALQEWDKWSRVALADMLWRQDERMEFKMPFLPFKRRK